MCTAFKREFRDFHDKLAYKSRRYRTFHPHRPGASWPSSVGSVFKLDGDVAMAAGRGVVLYDYMLVRGGAERLTLTLLDNLPDVDLIYGYGDEAAFPDQVMRRYRHTDLHARSGVPVWRALKVLHNFRQCRAVADYDWALFSGASAPLAVHQRIRAGHNYYYCHTIPRFAYDLRDYYRARTRLLARPLFDAFSAYVRRGYADAVARMDTVIANSENVRGRLQRYLGVDAVVVNPPIETDRFRWLEAGEEQSDPRYC